MSSEIMLLPFEGDRRFQCSNTILRLCGFAGDYREDGLFRSLIKLREKAEKNYQFVPDGFTSHLSMEIDEETGYDGVHYGVISGIIYVIVRDLLELEDLHKEYYKGCDSDNIEKEKALATMAYIKTLPENRKIALSWH